MKSRYKDDTGSDLTAIAATALVVLGIATGGALVASHEGAFDPAGASARLRVLQPVQTAPRMTARAPSGGIDMTETASTMVATSTAPACDVETCALAYRSFRSSDCTFQPFGGERKLCTR